MFSILIFMQNKKLSKEIINKAIEKEFNINVDEIKNNTLDKKFIKKYMQVYNKTFNMIMENIK